MRTRARRLFHQLSLSICQQGSLSGTEVDTPRDPIIMAASCIFCKIIKGACSDPHSTFPPQRDQERAGIYIVLHFHVASPDPSSDAW